MHPQANHPMGDPRGGGGGGFINQHMKLLTLLTLSIHLGVETVLLPRAVSRDTFEVSSAHWEYQSADSLWDVDTIRALLRRHNISLALEGEAEQAGGGGGGGVSGSGNVSSGGGRVSPSVGGGGAVAARRALSSLTAPATAAAVRTPASAAAAAVVMQEAAKTPAAAAAATAASVVAPPAAAKWSAAAATTAARTPAAAAAATAAGVAALHSTLVLPTYFCRVLPIETLAEDIRRLVHMHIGRLPARPSKVVAVTLNAPDLILAMRTSNLPLYTEVAAAVRFAPCLTRLADGITQRMMDEGPAFNGLHLRVEGDMRQVHNTSIESELRMYRRYIGDLNYSRSPLFVASGIFAPGGAITQKYSGVGTWLKEAIVGAQYASRIVNRRQQFSTAAAAAAAGGAAPPTALPGSLMPLHSLHSEQQAAVDFLVLLRADKVVGTRLSSFSFVLREFRLLWGRHERSTLGIIGGQWPLFEAAAGFDMSRVPY